MLLLAAWIGGGGFVSVKNLLNMGYTPYQVIGGRFLLAIFCLFLFYGRKVFHITKQEWKYGSVLGVFLAFTFLLLTVGLQYTTPSINAFLCNIPAVIVPFICWIAFRKKPTPQVLLAATLTAVGVGMLSIKDGFRLDIGAVLSLGAAVAFSLQMAFMSRFLENSDSIHIALVENGIVALLFVPVLLFTRKELPPLTLEATGNFFYVGALCTAVYFVLQSIGQRYTSATKTAIIITMESVFAALISIVLYGERLHLKEYLGCGLIFGAVILAEFPLGCPMKGEKAVDKGKGIG